MQYLCLIYQDETAMSQLSEREWQGLMQDCMTYTEMLLEGNHYLDGNILAPVHTATTLRLRQGKLCTTDGPFAETKEQLAGYCLLEARDLNQAIHLASLMPPARYGCVEVRPLRDPASPADNR